jgi:acetoin utilization deacetylase AcuC-like enzyme
VQAITTGGISPQAMREIGFPWSEAMGERARRSVGATVAASRSAFLDGIAANLAGGTHHSYADKGSGFCVFNDAADAARLIQAEHDGSDTRPMHVAIIDLDVDLPDGCGDDDYLNALEHALDELERHFNPALVIYLAGSDPFEGDRLSRLKLSYQGLEARDRRVFEWVWQRRVPLAMTMAGDHGLRIEETVQVQINTWRVALEYWQRWQQRR